MDYSGKWSCINELEGWVLIGRLQSSDVDKTAGMDFVKHLCRLSISGVDPCWLLSIQDWYDNSWWLEFLTACAHHKLTLWVVEVINGYANNIRVSVCCVISYKAQFAMRQDPIGGSHEGYRVAVEIKSELCKNMLCVCVCACVRVCVCVCVHRYGCFCCLPRSLIWRVSIIRAVNLDPHYNMSEYSGDKLHSCRGSSCPPWQADTAIHHFTGYPWAASKWLLSSLCTGVQEARIHISCLKFVCSEMTWSQEQRWEGGGGGPQGGRKSAVEHFLNLALGQIIFA